MNRNYRYIIIGSGVAGVAAAEAIRRQDSEGSMALIGDEAAGFYSRPGLAYYLTGEVNEKQLFPFTTADFKALRLRRLNARVIQIRPQTAQLVLQDGSSLYYERLLIATGAQAAQLRIPGSNMAGVVKLDNLEDARRILKLARKGNTAIVIGGGITALELAEGLVCRGMRTHYFLRGERYWSNVLDPTESKIVEKHLQEKGVHLHYHTETAEILGRDGQAAGVFTGDGKTFPCDLVAAAVGILPRKELAEEAGLSTERGILVNEYLQTSDPAIFAAGDVAQVFDPLSGKAVLDSLWGPAREQGTVAGLNMAGQKQAYFKSVPCNVTRLADLPITIIGTVGSGEDQDLLGIARGDSETWRHLPQVIPAQVDYQVNRLRLLVGQTNLYGALIIGDQHLSQIIQNLIALKVDIRPIREQLIQANAPVADLIADFWNSYATQHYHETS